MLVRQKILIRNYKELVDFTIGNGLNEGNPSLFTYESYGTHYNPFTFAIVSDTNLAISDQPEKLSLEYYLDEFKLFEKTGKSFEQKLLFLIKQTTFIHEVRHFHDCLCTKVGIQEFIHTVVHIDRILKSLRSIKYLGGYIKEPIFVTASKNEINSDYYKQTVGLVNECYKFKLYRNLFNGDLPSKMGSVDLTNIDIIWNKYELVDSENNDIIEVPCFPLTAFIDGEKNAILYPLGFRAMTEGQAIILQNQYLRSLGDEYPATYHYLLKSQPVYTVLNMLLTRISRNSKVDIGKLGGEDYLYELIDYSLHNGPMYTFLQKESHPIYKFIETILESDMLDEKVKKTEIFETELGFQNTHLDHLEQGTKIILKWVIKYIWNNAKIKTSETSEKYNSLADKKHKLIFNLVNFAVLPTPPFSFQGNLLGYNWANEEISELLSIYIPWLFLMDIIDSLLSLTNELKCPIAYRKYGPLHLHDIFHTHEYCKTSFPNGKCGNCKMGESIQHHVDCHWKSTLIDLALVQE